MVVSGWKTTAVTIATTVATTVAGSVAGVAVVVAVATVGGSGGMTVRGYGADGGGGTIMTGITDHFAFPTATLIAVVVTTTVTKPY